jgi:hypothetical protein
MLRASADIDFTRQKPERVRGVAGYRGAVNWDALELVVRTSEGSELEKQYFRKRFFKAIKENGIEAMTPWFRYHYVCARLALGDFSDYWGWEFRDMAEGGAGDWAARLYWDETWLPKWGGGGVNRLLVLGEQGVGDQVFFASILPEAMTRCAEVIYECDERLHSLLERSLPGLKCRPERMFEDRRHDYGAIDAFIPAADLMRMFRRSKKHFPGRPYLKPDPARAAEFERFRGRAGVAWHGRQGSLDPLALGLEHPLSVQYKELSRDIEQAPLDLWADIEGVVALTSVLDRVVTVPQSVLHFAGAQGLRVEVIEPTEKGEHGQVVWDRVRYDGGKTPWYANTRCFESLAAWRAERAA